MFLQPDLAAFPPSATQVFTTNSTNQVTTPLVYTIVGEELKSDGENQLNAGNWLKSSSEIARIRLFVYEIFNDFIDATQNPIYISLKS